MEKYIKAIFDLTKLPTKFFLLLSIVSGFILFINQEFLSGKLFLGNVKEKYGEILGPIFILSSGLVIINTVIWTFTFFYRRIIIRRLKRKFLRKIKSFDSSERSILREFFMLGQRSIEMPIDNPTVSGLLHNNILVMNYQFGNTSIMRGMNTSLSIHESVLEVLTLEDVDWCENPTKEKINWAKNNRPGWKYNKRFF